MALALVQPVEVPEARRAPRVTCSIPLELTGLGKTVYARSAVIGPNGFLALSSGRWPHGTYLRVVNERNGLAAEARVVWQGVCDETQYFKYGIAFTFSRPDFWGADYPDFERAAEQKAQRRLFAEATS
jgi:hypothetical protein